MIQKAIFEPEGCDPERCPLFAVYTEDMFKTTHDAANREVVKAVIRGGLNLVGLAMRAERKVIDKIVDGLKFRS